MHNAATDRKKVFLIGPLPTCERDGTEITPMKDKLADTCDLIYAGSLDDRVVEVVKSASANRRFDAIVTHMPPNRGNVETSSFTLPSMYSLRRYRTSIGHVTSIKRIDPHIVAIAYTGAGEDAYLALSSSGLDGIVFKTRDIFQDAERVSSNLTSSLKDAFLDYGQETPELRTEEGYTLADTEVNFVTGAGIFELGGLVKFAAENRDTEMWIVKDGQEYSARDTMGLLTAEMYRGVPITVKVEGTGEVAAEMVYSICSIFASRYCFDVSLDRFKKETPNLQ